MFTAKQPLHFFGNSDLTGCSSVWEHQELSQSVCDSPNLVGVQGVAGGPVYRHFAHDEHHDFSSLIVWQVSTKEAWQDTRHEI